ncbi:MAG: 6-phosphogluconolactonase [Salinisphaera sp.]|jgi:6-phosphogluconolactonase|nr:6-phosphogluconolactonase [Salinisphaera sp.]
MAELHKYNSRALASRQLAADIAARLQSAIAERGKASLVVCGGSSPVALFRALRQELLEWQRVTVIPSDERWVSIDHQDSNEAMIRRELLVDEAAQACFLPLYRDTQSPEAAVDEVCASLSDISLPLDVVLLGMGDDGHTASLFPHDPDIASKVGAEASCVAAEVGPPKRLSLSLRYLTKARSIDVLIFGDDKLAVFQAAQHPGPLAQYPVRGILRSADPIAQVHWAR